MAALRDTAWVLTLALGMAGLSCTERSAPSVEATRPDSSPGAATPLRILVPTADNLQVMTFWLALDAVEHRGDAIELLIPPAPQATRAWLERERPDLAILPAPVLLDHLASGASTGPGRVLLTHDPINLVVRRSVATKRSISIEQPLTQRLSRLQGLKVGIAPHPPPRLDALFAAAGLRTREVIEVVIVGGKQQNRSFGDGEVDALFAHTPYVERALLTGDAELVVHVSAGEIPALSDRVVHCALASAQLATHTSVRLERFFGALEEAHRRVREDPTTAARQLSQRFPARNAAEILRIVDLYRNAVPLDLKPTVEGLRKSLRYFPRGVEKPELDDETLRRFVDRN